MFAQLFRFRPAYKVFVADLLATFTCDQPGFSINLNRDDGRRRTCERLPKLTTPGRPFHEFRPDWESGTRAFNLEIRIVVVAYPDYTDQVRDVSGKPSIARSSGFSGGCNVESTVVDAGSSSG